MASNIGEIRTKVETRIKDEAIRLGLAEVVGDIDQALLAAVAEYQLIRPRKRVAKVAGTGAFDYPLDGGSPILAGWQVEFSDVLEVVYPYNASEQNPPVLDQSQYAVVQLDTGYHLRFRSATPATSEFFLATYSTPHTLNVSTSTVRATDDEALADLGTSFAFLKLAAVYAQDTDSSIQADAVDRRTKPDIYRSLAADYRKRYEVKLELGQAQGPATAMAVITSPTDSHRFFH